MLPGGWRRGSTLLRIVTFENGGATHVAFGRNRAGLPDYRHDGARRTLVPLRLAALMTLRLRHRRLASIPGEFGTIIDDPQP